MWVWGMARVGFRAAAPKRCPNFRKPFSNVPQNFALNFDWLSCNGQRFGSA
jgi:hypothetical protein